MTVFERKTLLGRDAASDRPLPLEIIDGLSDRLIAVYPAESFVEARGSQAISNGGARLNRMQLDADCRQLIAPAPDRIGALQIDVRRSGEVPQHELERGLATNPVHHRFLNVVDIEVEQACFDSEDEHTRDD